MGYFWLAIWLKIGFLNKIHVFHIVVELDFVFLLLIRILETDAPFRTLRNCKSLSTVWYCLPHRHCKAFAVVLDPVFGWHHLFLHFYQLSLGKIHSLHLQRNSCRFLPLIVVIYEEIFFRRFIHIDVLGFCSEAETQHIVF